MTRSTMSKSAEGGATVSGLVGATSSAARAVSAVQVDGTTGGREGVRGGEEHPAARMARTVGISGAPFPIGRSRPEGRKDTEMVAGEDAPLRFVKAHSCEEGLPATLAVRPSNEDVVDAA